MDISKSDIIESLAGRDKGKFFYVIETEENFVLIADGKTRKLANPKKKNPLHLQKTLSAIELTDITDKKLRTALIKFNVGAHIAEESD